MEHLLIFLKDLLPTPTPKQIGVTLLGLALGGAAQSAAISLVGKSPDAIVYVGVSLGTCIFWAMALFLVEAACQRLRKGLNRQWQLPVIGQIYIGACALALFFTARACYVFDKAEVRGTLYSHLVDSLIDLWVPTAVGYVIGAIVCNRLHRRVRLVKPYFKALTQRISL